MKLFLLLMFSSNFCYALDPIISYSESIYQKVNALSEVCTTGKTIASGQTIGIHSIRLNGADPDSYIIIVFDRGGGSEKIFSSTAGDVDIKLDLSDTVNQVTGDGTKKLKVCIINDKTVQSPIVGGAYEAVNL